MESDAIEKILESVAAGKTTPAEALLSLKKEPFTDLGYAKVDHHRALRQNAAEVIYGEGKTPDQIRGIAESLQQGGAKTVLVTRMKPEAVSLMTNHFADEFTYFDIPRVGLLGHMPEPTGNGTIVVAAAGTSDMYAAEEAALTAEALGKLRAVLALVGGIAAPFEGSDGARRRMGAVQAIADHFKIPKSEIIAPQPNAERFSNYPPTWAA